MKNHVSPMTDIRIWIVGAGHFGRLAVERLAHFHEPRHMLVIDVDENALAPLASTGVHLRRAEGADFLNQYLDPDAGPDWIIPAVPVHLVHRWLLARLKPQAGALVLPDHINALLPNPWPAEGGGLFVSFADSICPDDCPEPSTICTATGRPRKGLLYRYLQDLALSGWSMCVIRSRQLAPGVGGLKNTDILDLENRIKKSTGPVIVGTACKCHGVLHGLELHS
jgi:hypothetical protein